MGSDESITDGLRTRLRERRRDSSNQPKIEDLVVMLGAALAEIKEINEVRRREAEAKDQRLTTLENLLRIRRDDAKETSSRQSHPDTDKETEEDDPPEGSESDSESYKD